MARTILASILSFLLAVAPILSAQEPAAVVPPAPAKPAGTYVIGPGDLLSITVYDAPDLSRDVRVSASGVILMPLIPQPVQADGLTPEELALSLAREFSERQILRNPQVTVLVKEYKSRPVAVLGAVKKPQMLPLYGPITLLEVLSAAEGLTDDAGPLIYVTRGAALRELPASAEAAEPDAANPRVVTIKVRELMDAQDPAANIPIYAGDMVTVPRGGIVYVVGAVKRPGGFVLKDRHEQVSVLQALALAEYVIPTAKADKAVIVRRTPGTDREETIPVNVSQILARKAADVPMQENDILYIPDSAFKRGMRRMAEAAIQLTSGIIIWGIAAQ